MKLIIYRFLLVVFLGLFVISTAYSTDVPKGIKLTKQGNGYIVNFDIQGYKMLETKAEGEIYLDLVTEEYGVTPEVGLPKLPQITFCLLIGNNELTPTFSLTNQNTQQLILNNKIYPSQMPWEKIYRLEDRPFVINKAYYNSKGSIDNPFVKISEPFVIAGAKGVMVTIFPFAYNPSANELRVTQNGSFKINLNNPAQLSITPSQSFSDLYRNIFLNYTPSKFTPTNRYLIITAPEFETALAPFVTHKTNMGYIVSVVTTTVAGTTKEAIKAYIQNLYNNISTRPEFILLVGDVDKIPEWIGGGEGTPHTDWNYALLEGNDLYVDAFLGRFPITTTAQLGNIITKTIYMENQINSLWKKNVFMASTDNHAITEGTHNMVIDSFFIPNSYTVNTKLYSYNGATTAQVSASIDSGKVFAIYSGHGSETSWADGPVFTQANVNALNNTIFPYVYSYACITGSYHVAYECFAETWIRSPKAGVVFWGSSVNSYWTEDDILERKVVKSLFADNLKKNSPNFVQGKIYTIQYFGSITPTMQRYIEMYNCMGDPSIYQVSYGPSIAHTPLQNTENLAGPYVVNCVVTPAGNPITSTKLFWTRTVAFDSIIMSNTGGNNWAANIPGNNSPALYKYYLRTIDNAGLTTYLPGGAPANYFSFVASADTVKPVITHTAIGNTPKTAWPVSVTANATDNIGIDSVWVVWYKNNTSTTKRFKLNLTTGSTYTAPFNSVNADVVPNDSIFYKVFAQDAGSNHKKDSTALYNFKIIAQTTCCIGTGTTAISNYPFNTFWWGNRTHMLWTSAEILGNMGAAGSISRIGFQISTAASQPMNGFMIRMQHTTNTTVTGFSQSGWTTVYSGTYTVPGTGWQYIDLQTPFIYNGTQNLLVDICFGNSSYTSATTVLGTSAPGMSWYYYADVTTACTNAAGSVGANRPNVCFVINTMVNTSNNTSIIPEKYSLSQNYPNPFNPVTRIKYDIPKQGLVTMKIYDVLGREVTKLVNEVKAPGSYLVDFDGTNLSSGVYFYKLEAGTFSDVKRMMLIK